MNEPSFERIVSDLFAIKANTISKAVIRKLLKATSKVGCIFPLFICPEFLAKTHPTLKQLGGDMIIIIVCRISCERINTMNST